MELVTRLIVLQMRRITSTILVVALLGLSVAQTNADKPKRARPPRADSFPTGIFFKDAFREGLVGSRPATLGIAASTGADGKRSSNSSAAGTNAGTNSPGKTGGQRWSDLVSARTLEDEVKLLQMQVQTGVSTPGRFSGGGYRDVRRLFSELATLFAVIGNYDQQVRWKSESPVMRDLFARAASNAKVTSVQAFNEAKLRKADLEDLVRGGSVDTSAPVEQANDWSKISDRGPLMQRIGQAYDDRLLVWTANEKEFRQHTEQLTREGELLRLFAVVMTHEGMEDAGDDDYEAYCRQLQSASTALLEAIRLEDADAGRKAVSDIGKSCTNCHDDYRG